MKNVNKWENFMDKPNTSLFPKKDIVEEVLPKLEIVMVDREVLLWDGEKYTNVGEDFKKAIKENTIGLTDWQVTKVYNAMLKHLLGLEV